jgi:hypothetical protein
LFYIELLNLYVFLNTLPFFGGSYFETIPKGETRAKQPVVQFKTRCFALALVSPLGDGRGEAFAGTPYY